MLGDLGPQRVVEPDLPGRAGGELLTGDEPAGEPPVDGGDPDAQFGLARAYAPSDQVRMGRALTSILNYNSNHVAAMLLLADHLVDAEQYDDAETILSTWR